MKRVLFLILPNVHMLDLGGPLQILGSVAELGIAPLALQCIGPRPQLTSFQGAALQALAPLPARLQDGDVVIAIGSKLQLNAPLPQPHQQAAQWLSRVARQDGVTVASVCTGAFLLGEAGLLDQRLCTTHHDYLQRLQQRYPQARVLERRLLVEDGHLLTSAGVSAGIDLALHLIARHFGAAAALAVARDNVVQFRRLEADPELDLQLRYRSHAHPLVHAVQDFLSQQPASPLSFEQLAERYALSYRHLARLFQRECGITLKQYQQQLRLELARQLLRDTRWPVEAVAERCGFASLQAFRAAWNKEQALPPSRWRATM